jgi:hypothetical protein
MNTNCPDIPLWELEQYWAQQTTGAPFVQPKWTYAVALEQVTTPPNTTYQRGSTLNYTVTVDPAGYEVQRNFMVVFEKMETIQVRYM